MKYLNLKKITAVVLSIGMVFSSSAVTGFAADNSKKIATIPPERTRGSRRKQQTRF